VGLFIGVASVFFSVNAGRKAHQDWSSAGSHSGPVGGSL
jgi:hypothetical protein